jgi:hypothetical protein
MISIAQLIRNKIGIVSNNELPVSYTNAIAGSKNVRKNILEIF